MKAGILLLVLSVAGMWAGTWPAAARGATPKQVDDAIHKLVDDIYSRQKGGNWEGAENVVFNAARGDQTGGPTAIAVYALLAAGENPDDPRIHSALQYLEQANNQGMYAIAIRTQAFLLAMKSKKERPAAQAALQRDAGLLQRAAHPWPGLEASSAFYRYHLDSNNIDLSCSQYAVLGMWACEQGEVEIPIKYWKEVDSGWRAIQYPDGGWSYDNTGGLGKPHASGKPPSINMTCAGIATLFITSEYLHGMDGIDCPGNSVVDKNIKAGFEFIIKNYAELNSQNPEHFFYGFYGIERIGVASGYKYFGTIDWYKDGANCLVDRKPHLLSDACFVLLFLVRGRAPVVLNKLQYDINMHGDTPREGNWNQRPRDAANFAKWVGKETEEFLNWQIVNLKVPSTELHDAPILYIAGGGQALDFTDEEIDKLRKYVEDGGLIYCNADCASTIFTTSMHKVCRKLFPDYEFANLPADSPIYTRQQFLRSRWHSPPKPESLSNGARELVIIVPTGDPSRYWQTQTFGGHEDLFQFPDDVFLYAIDKGERGGLRVKGDTYIVLPDPKIQPVHSIKIARLQYAGNWNPEPGSWRRLAAVVHNTNKVDLDVQSVPLGAGKLDNTFRVAHLTGPFKFSLTQAAREEIKKYVLDGGTLIVDACGGREDFAQSAQSELAAIFPDNKLADAPLPLSSPVFGSEPILTRVDYRAFARNIVGSLHVPRLRTIDINGRSAVFFSAEDLSVGMVGMQIDGIYGYDPASATALMQKLVLYAAGKATPTTAPTTMPTTMPTTIPTTAPTTQQGGSQ